MGTFRVGVTVVTILGFKCVYAYFCFLEGYKPTMHACLHMHMYVVIAVCVYVYMYMCTIFMCS